MLVSSSRDAASAFRMGLVCAVIPLILASALIVAGGGETPSYPWFSLLGINIEFSLYARGFSLWMAWLTAFLVFISFLFFKELFFGTKKFAAIMLVLEGAIIGAFLSAQNLVQFLFFFEAMIIPAAILIALFGGLRRRRAVVIFSLYTVAGSIPLLFASWYLILKAGSDNISAITQAAAALPVEVQCALLVSFFLAFAVKTPMFPLHSWQAVSYSEAPYQLSAILSGAMAKVGVFGFAVWTIPVFGSILQDSYNICFIVIALFSMIYGAILAFSQTDIKKLLAFSSMSHLGLAVAGLFCLNDVVTAGVCVMLVGHGLTAGGLFFFSGIAQKWTGTTNIKQYGAFAGTNKVYATIFGIVGIAAIAVPSTIGFVGEFLILQGLFASDYSFLAIIGGIGIILSAAYMLRLIKCVLFGEEQLPRASVSLSAFEGAAAIPIIALIFYFGLHPAQILNSFPQEKQTELSEEEMQQLEEYIKSMLELQSLEETEEMIEEEAE